MTFEKWMELVDDEFIVVTTLHRDGWADQDYWYMWESGETPAAAVRNCIENEYGDEGLIAFYGSVA